MWAYNYSDQELYHAGIKGMKWGVRRYQNKDGSLTPAGQKRYERDQRENAGRKKGNKIGEADPGRWVREDTTRSKSLVDSTSQLNRSLREANKIDLSKPKSRMDLSNMTDKEMRDRINRELLERQYDSVFNPKEVSSGRANVDKILEVSGSVLAITGSALGIALAIKDLRG